MQENPLISVIIPVYNVEEYLEKCVDSVLQQDYDHLEILLIDDGSSDQSGKICDEYAQKDSRVLVIHQKNGGVSCARNTGVANASGQYITFVDSDDYVSVDFVSFMYELICKHHAQISSCGAVNIQPSGKQILVDTDFSEHVMGRHEALERMCYNDGFYITLWDKLFAADLFDGIRFPEGKLFEDTGVTYQLVFRAEKIVACCEPKYFYVTKGNTITTSVFKRSKLDYVEMADQMGDDIVRVYPDLKPAADRKRLHAYFSTLCQLVNSSIYEKDVVQMLTAKIKTVRKSVLKNKRTPRRDKFAVVSLMLGFRFFSFAWKVYERIWKN